MDEARANAATPGPWEVGVLRRESDHPTTNQFTEERYLFPPIGESGPVALASEAEFANGAFLAAARTDVPDLVAEVRRLTDALATARNGARDGHALADAIIARLRAEHAAALATARREGAEEMRERAANVCERMVVGGCAWSEEQASAGRALLDAAGNIRALPLDAPGGAT